MKKLLMLLTIPLFVACGKEDIDPTLNGMWEGKITTSASQVSIGLNNEIAAVTDTLIYKFDNENIQVIRSRDGTLENQVEIESGIYTLVDGLIDYKITKHSCVNENTKPSSKKIIYSVGSDLNTLTISLSPGKKIILTRLNESDALAMDQLVSVSQTGCFVESGKKFKPGPIGVTSSPAVEVDLSQKIDEIEVQTAEELNQEI